MAVQSGSQAPLRRVWIDTNTGLPLPDPYPEYVACPNCGEPEVEVWCFEPRARCHRCGTWIEHRTPECLGSSEACRSRVQRPAA